MSVTHEIPPAITLYRGSSKHKNRPAHEQKGTLCPEWTHRTPTGGFASDVHAHEWGGTEAAKLFASAVIDPSGKKRYATAKGIAFEARPTADGTWHGFPIPWESVPREIKDMWLDSGVVTRREVKKIPELRPKRDQLGDDNRFPMTDFAQFGDPARFEIAVAWTDDSEPRERRPARGGWSTGVLRLTVANHVLTRHEYTGGDQDSVRWYLLPIFEWLATNWVSLLHEERFAWRENSSAAAATACFMALRRLIDAQSPSEQAEYAEVQKWWSRHALRAADSSALLPDLVLRRLINDIEISWTARQPSYAPDGFRFALAPGVAMLPIDDVATPLWEALAWAVSSPPAGLNEDDRRSLAELETKISQLKVTTTLTLERAYLPAEIFEKLATARRETKFPDRSLRSDQVPAIKRIDDAVLMFGGVSPDIGAADTQRLVTLLERQRGGDDGEKLASLVDTAIGLPLTAPFQEGYDLAEELLEAINVPTDATFVDVRSIISDLGIHIIDEALHTSTIRGVAVAGMGYYPAILVNRTSLFNAEEVGRRFTLAHEFFHVLFDRERAKRVSHTSGPWAPPSIEKRANAFAAMLLMPRNVVRRSLPADGLTSEKVRETAQSMRVGVSALVEHLYNLSMIDEFKRDELRASLQTV